MFWAQIRISRAKRTEAAQNLMSNKLNQIWYFSTNPSNYSGGGDLITNGKLLKP